MQFDMLAGAVLVPGDHPRITLSLRPLKCWSDCTVQQCKNNHSSPGKMAGSLAQPSFWDSFLPHGNLFWPLAATAWGKTTSSPPPSGTNSPATWPREALPSRSPHGQQTTSSRTQRRDTWLNILHHQPRFLPDFQVFLPCASGNPWLGGDSPTKGATAPGEMLSGMHPASMWEEQAFLGTFRGCYWV